jgi:hypothetical protein
MLAVGFPIVGRQQDGATDQPVWQNGH